VVLGSVRLENDTQCFVGDSRGKHPSFLAASYPSWHSAEASYLDTIPGYLTAADVSPAEDLSSATYTN